MQGQLPRRIDKGPSQGELKRHLWKVGEDTAEVQMTLDKVWDASAGRWRVSKGGVWLVEARCVLVEGEESWVLDQLPAELSEQAYMWQWEQGVDGDNSWRPEWMCSGGKPGAGEEQPGTMDWVSESWEQKEAEEGFAEGQNSNYWEKATMV